MQEPGRRRRRQPSAAGRRRTSCTRRSPGSARHSRTPIVSRCSTCSPRASVASRASPRGPTSPSASPRRTSRRSGGPGSSPLAATATASSTGLPDDDAYGLLAALRAVAARLADAEQAARRYLGAPVEAVSRAESPRPGARRATRSSSTSARPRSTKPGTSRAPSRSRCQSSRRGWPTCRPTSRSSPTAGDRTARWRRRAWRCSSGSAGVRAGSRTATRSGASPGCRWPRGARTSG